jgi:hypothetical protein
MLPGGWACADCGVQVRREAAACNPLLLPQAREALLAESLLPNTHTIGPDQCCASRHDHGPLQDAAAWFGCCLCCVNRGLDPRWCKFCTAKWQRLRAFEHFCSAESDAVGRESDGKARVRRMVDSAGATRKLVGRALRYRVDLVCCSLLLESPEGVEALVDQIASGGFRNECTDAKGTARVVGSDGRLDVSDRDSRAEQSRCPRSADTCAGFRRSMPAHLRVRSIASGPFGKLEGTLTALDVSGNARLERLPLASLVTLGSLTALDCAGCARLEIPPREIALQGGKAVVKYGRLLAQDGCTVSSMQLISLGSATKETRIKLVGELILRELIHAGRPLSGRGGGEREKVRERKGERDGGEQGAQHCRNDTQGRGKNGGEGGDVWLADSSDQGIWDLSDSKDADGLLFKVQHLREGGASDLSNALLCARRALYLLVFIVARHTKPAQSVREVLQWLKKLQLFVPGARVLLVAVTDGRGSGGGGKEGANGRGGTDGGVDEGLDHVRATCSAVEREVRRLVSRLFLCEQRHGPPALEVGQKGESTNIPWSLVSYANNNFLCK